MRATINTKGVTRSMTNGVLVINSLHALCLNVCLKFEYARNVSAGTSTTVQSVRALARKYLALCTAQGSNVQQGQITKGISSISAKSMEGSVAWSGWNPTINWAVVKTVAASAAVVAAPRASCLQTRTPQASPSPSAIATSPAAGSGVGESLVAVVGLGSGG